MGNFSTPVWELAPTGPDELPGVAHGHLNFVS